ncbi:MULTISPECIES: DHA2 family efflux MFS transporter permease subunit [unclassified Janthinobacterium]|uniref:DHA2 family efflux MFS transporter permease subunit n=1 Tax=unclassified Janthinobacterium TaxID=2610881 RepID=UPI00161804F6|nr:MULTISPECIES: DHA2 family efflux MFS transporter permease subunit [unclassified Janthinobacterium]MBB5610785.1 EmrB/QacA subfamily drug resistance transporter [Janthinobacterium sp. S3T4]MBB5616271.1 EmrB/QacA subfamily drug resistance transporter [Janthinobacterium sp. S3M3]
MNNHIESRRRWLALAGIAIASFLGCIDFTIVNTAIPAIQGQLSASVDQVQWVVTVFVMALSACMVAAGRLADLLGRRRLLYLGMLVFGLASLGAGLASSIAILIAWRLVQGVACAALYTTSAAIVAHAFPESERGRALGLLFAANGLGLAVGPVAGGLLVASLGWRSVFLLNVPLIVIAFMLCLGRVAESRGEEGRQRFDAAGFVLLALALPCLLLAIGQGGSWGWTSLATVGTAGLALVLLLAFVWVERMVAVPLLQMTLFANGRFLLASLANFSLAFFYCAAFFLLPLYLGEVRGQGSSQIGWLLLPITAVMALVSPQAGRAADRFGTAPLLAAGFVFLTLSAAMQAAFVQDSSWTWVVVALACMGIGWGCILGPATVAALASVPPQLAGVAMGAAWTLHNVGAALGLTIATVVFQAAGGKTAFLLGFQAAFWLLLMLSLLTLACLLPGLWQARGARAPATGQPG